MAAGHRAPGRESAAGKLKAVEKIRNAKGEVIKVRRIGATSGVARSDADSTADEGPGDFACVNNRDRKKLVIYQPYAWAVDNRKMSAGVVWHLYEYKKARQVEGGWTEQFLLCATGGMDGQNGWRFVTAGPGQAWKNDETTTRIGWKWKSGETPSDFEISLGFQVGRGPVSIEGSITQRAYKVLKGALTAPYETRLSRYGINAVAGWWNAGCSTRCWRWQGSPDFQGNVAQGLWEFRNSRKGRTFVMQPFGKYYCASGSCPGD